MLKCFRKYNNLLSLGADCTPPHYLRGVLTPSPFDHVFLPVRNVAQVIGTDIYDLALLENLKEDESVRTVCSAGRVFETKYNGEIWNHFKSGADLKDGYIDFRKQFDEAVKSFTRILKDPSPVLFVRKHNEFEAVWEIFLKDIEAQYNELSDSISTIRGKNPFLIIAIGSSPDFRKSWTNKKVMNHFVGSSQSLKDFYDKIKKMVKLNARELPC